MKIVCDACQAKYSISDDKVQGKVFKIRCKKCSNIIVVRGGAGASEPAAPPQEKDTRVYDYGYDGAQPPAGDEAVWHLVIDQDQVGPMTVAEVQRRFAAGEIDGETFTWREGFADWMPLGQVDTFAALVASGSTTAAVGGGAAAVASMFGTGTEEAGTVRSDPGDLFAAASAGSSHHHDDDAGGDLFGSKPVTTQAQAQAAAQKLRGERNENSVLFSLNNLAQLASDKPAPTASVTSVPSGHATGAAGGEGSGLIDIRSMASAYLGGQGAATGKPATSSAIGSIDDLPVFGGGGFSEPAVIVPTARAASSNKVLYLMIGAVGLLAVVAVVMVVMLLRGPKTVKVAANDKTAAADTTAPTSDKTEPAAENAKPASDKPTEAEAAPAGSAAPDKGSAAEAEAAATPSPEKAEPAPEHKSEPAREHHSSHHHAAVASRESHAHAEPKPPKADSGGGGCDEVSCVLNNYEGACCAKFKKGGGHASGGGGGGGNSNLPEQLNTSMVSAGIASVKGRVSACGNRSSAKGAVKVHVKVSGSGRVSGVSVLSSPDAGLGACVKAAVKRASFAQTQRGGSFSYPFIF